MVQQGEAVPSCLLQPALAWTLLSGQGITIWVPTFPAGHWGGAGRVWEQPGWLDVGYNSSRSTEPEFCRGIKSSFSNKCNYTNMLEPCVLFNSFPRKEAFLRALLLSESKRMPSASGILSESTVALLCPGWQLILGFRLL